MPIEGTRMLLTTEEEGAMPVVMQMKWVAGHPPQYAAGRDKGQLRR